MPENHDFSAFSCFIKFQSPRNVYLVVFFKNKNGTMRLIVIYYSIISSILIFKDYATFEMSPDSKKTCYYSASYIFLLSTNFVKFRNV